LDPGPRCVAVCWLEERCSVVARARPARRRSVLIVIVRIRTGPIHVRRAAVSSRTGVGGAVTGVRRTGSGTGAAVVEAFPVAIRHRAESVRTGAGAGVRVPIIERTCPRTIEGWSG
jgi:hypothetical protein